MEGMWMMHRQGTYYMFYSSCFFQLPCYRLGVARAENILGPYTKASAGLVMCKVEYKEYVISNCPSQQWTHCLLTLVCPTD